MNFQPELAERILQGRKTVTRRAVSPNPRSPYHPTRIGQMVGRSIAICPGRGKHAIAKATVLSVSRALFHPDRISAADLQAEGFAGDFGAWEDTWTKLHGNLDPVDVWRIELGAVVPV